MNHFNEGILYESEWKQPMTVDDILRIFSEIKERFGGELQVSSYDEEAYYQSVTQVSVQSVTTDNELVNEVRIDNL